MPIHISTGNNKLGNIANISLTPGTGASCGTDIPCARHCYAMRIYRRLEICRRNWDDNYEKALHSSTIYFDEIRDFLKRERPPYFRWHVSGDIVNMNYALAMNHIAHEFSNTKFLAFTKEYHYVSALHERQNMASNLTLVLSMWPGGHGYGNRRDYALKNLPQVPKAWLIPNDKNHDQAGVKREEILEYKKLMPSSYFVCKGKCTNCKVCWQVVKLGIDVGFKLH